MLAGAIVVLLVLGVGALFVKDDADGPIAQGTPTPTDTATDTPTIAPTTTPPTPVESEPTDDPTPAGDDDDDSPADDDDDAPGDDDDEAPADDDDDDIPEMPKTGVGAAGLLGWALIGGSGILALRARRRV